MSDSKYPHIVRAVASTPWAIDPDKLVVILDLLELRARGERLSDEEIQARVGGQPARKDMVMAGSVAVVPLYGVLIPRADAFSEMSGATSIQRFSDAFQAAVDDSSVTGIVLDVDSPGGQVGQIPEMAAQIRAARGKKPIVAVANTSANSAAYWLASQADELVASPSALVGSIGVFAAHTDISGAQEQAGEKTTLVSAGKYKVEHSPFEPLSDDAKASLQSRIDDAYQMFTLDVSKGRKTSVDQVRNGFGEGRTLPARAALKEGMVDRIGTLDDTIARVQAQTAAKNGGASGTAPTGYAFVHQGETCSLVSDGLPPGTFTITTDNTAAASGLFSAPIGATFTDEAEALHAAAGALVDRASSLAEVRRGSLTGAKRDALAACSAGLREAGEALDALIAATDPDKDRKAGTRALEAFALGQLRPTP